MGSTKRRYFGYLSVKVYGGKPGDKAVGIHIKSDETREAIRLARAILQAVEYGQDIDITLQLTKTLTNGSTPITITSPTRPA